MATSSITANFRIEDAATARAFVKDELKKLNVHGAGARFFKICVGNLANDVRGEPESISVYLRKYPEWW